LRPKIAPGLFRVSSVAKTACPWPNCLHILRTMMDFAHAVNRRGDSLVARLELQREIQ
jgi:hypothetical protein